MSYWILLLSLICSVAVGWIYIPRLVIISRERNIYDETGGRKSHSGNIPRLAGLSFFPAFCLAFLVPTVIAYYLDENFSQLINNQFVLEISIFIGGLILLYMVGFIDDLISVSPYGKFAVQFICAGLLILCGLGIDNLDDIFGLNAIPKWIGIILTLLVVVFIINAYNLIDGIDGLCSSLALIALAVLGFWFSINGMIHYALVASAMIGVTVVYFFFNNSHGRFRTFMGDTGSTILGFTIAFLCLKYYQVNIEGIHIVHMHFQAPAAMILGLTLIPIFDTFRVFTIRIYNGLSPFHPDKRHIHHKLLELGLQHRYCTVIILSSQCCLMAINYLARNLNINIIICIDILISVIYITLLNYLIRLRRQRHAVLGTTNK